MAGGPVSRPTVPGNTIRGRKELLRSVGCPEARLDEAQEHLRVLVTPVRVQSGEWKVMAYLSAMTARRVVNRERSGGLR